MKLLRSMQQHSTHHSRIRVSFRNAVPQANHSSNLSESRCKLSTRQPSVPPTRTQPICPGRHQSSSLSRLAETKVQAAITPRLNHRIKRSNSSSRKERLKETVRAREATQTKRTWWSSSLGTGWWRRLIKTEQWPIPSPYSTPDSLQRNKTTSWARTSCSHVQMNAKLK